MLDKLLEKKLEFEELFNVYSSLLTSKQKEALELYFFDDLSYAEIGEVLGTSKQAVYDTINKAVKKLKMAEKNIGYIELKNKYDKLLEDKN